MRTRVAILIVLAVALTGCVKPGASTPAVPTTPEAKVLTITNTISSSLLLASSELVPLCQANKIDASTCSIVKHYLLAVNAANDQVTAEAGLDPATEPWAVAKGKIANIVASNVITMTVTDPTLQSTLNNLKNQLISILGVQ